MKTIILAFISILAISAGYAQENNKISKPFEFGLRHGYSLSNRYAGNSISSTNTEIYIGAFAERYWSERFGFRLESTYNLGSNLEFGLLSKYKLNNKWELYFGPQIEFSFENSFTEDYDNKTVGGSLVLGTQYNINYKWYLEARYTYGFTKQYQLANDPITPPAFGKRDAITLGVGYKF